MDQKPFERNSQRQRACARSKLSNERVQMLTLSAEAVSVLPYDMMKLQLCDEGACEARQNDAHRLDLLAVVPAVHHEPSRQPAHGQRLSPD